MERLGILAKLKTVWDKLRGQFEDRAMARAHRNQKRVDRTRLRQFLLPDGMPLVACEVQGNFMILDLEDAGISTTLALRGVHEEASTHWLNRVIRPGDNLLEIGGNIGYYLFMGMRLAGEHARALVLEPSSGNRRLLLANIALNRLETRVTVLPYAAGDKNEYRPFYVASKRNTSALSPPRPGSGIEMLGQEQVPVRTIDSLMEDFGDRIDFFRMDVEGFEWEIIEGMTATLTNPNGPRACFVEVHSELLAETGRSTKAFVNRMKSFGFEVEKAFYRGKSTLSVDSGAALLSHPLCERGYWETFFTR